MKVVPGPSAFVAAAALSGLPVGRFTFEGFLSMNRQSRREHLQSVAHEKRTMIFYEAPHKLSATLKDLFETLGDRRIAIVREITKIHEEAIRTTLRAAAERYAEETLKGEIVLVVEGEGEKADAATLEDAVALAKKYLEEGLSLSFAAKKAAKETGLKKGDIYNELI